MMPKINIVRKFALLSFIVMLVLGIVLGYTISEKIEEMMINRAKDTYANIVQQNIRIFLAPEFFSSSNFSRDKEAFEKYFSFLRTDEIVRIKVWNKDGTIVYSDVEELVGKSFADNTNFNNAMNGSVDIEIDRELTREEAFYEKQFKGLMEIYVPVRFDNGELAGVVELYQNLDFIDKEIYDARMIIWFIIFFGFSTLYFSLVWIVKGASNTIVQQSISLQNSNEELHKSEDKFRKLVESAPDAIVVVNSEGNILLVNSQTVKMFGFTREELINKPYEIMIPEHLKKKHRGRCAGYFVNPIATSIGHDLEIYASTRDGRMIPVEISLSPMETRDGIIVMCLIHDLTERKKAVELHIENVRLESASKAKSEFLAGMSHELRTPLNAVIGFAQLMKEGISGDLNEKQMQFVNNINTSGNHLLELINDILDLSKVEAGKVELVIDRMSVPETIKEGLILIKEKAQKRNIILITEFDPELEFIEADKLRFKQIIFNLLSNAVKFCREEGGTVTIRTKKEGDMAAIKVEDNGIGIKEENLGKLFQKFEQIDPKVTSKYGGTGLGLAITKKLVEMHRGTIMVESRYGESTTFTFKLPISWAKKEPDQ